MALIPVWALSPQMVMFLLLEKKQGEISEHFPNALSIFECFCVLVRAGEALSPFVEGSVRVWDV